MVGDEVDEDLRLDRDREVAAVLPVVDRRDRLDAGGAVDGEALDVLAELRPVTHEVLRGIAVRELGQHLGQLGVDGGAVVALHEVLDDELPVRPDVVGDPPADPEVLDAVALEGAEVPEPLDDLLQDGRLERRRVARQAHPQVAEPFPHGDRRQAVVDPVDVGHLGEVRRRDELAVEVVGPRVVRALEGALGLPRLLRAEPRAPVPTDVEVGLRLTLAVARQQHALTPDGHRPEGPGAGQLAGTGGTEPRLLEDVLLLRREEPCVRVVPAGQGGDEARGRFDEGHGRSWEGDDSCGWVTTGRGGDGMPGSWRRHRLNWRTWFTPRTATSSPSCR